MSKTAKNILDDIRGIASRFSLSDESNLDEDFLFAKINDVAAELKIDLFTKTQILQSDWLCDFGLVQFHKVNKADDPSITYCNCDIGKAFIPQMISFVNKDGNQDLGIYSLMSACGKNQYYPRPMFRWSYTPDSHSNSMFGSYWRANTSLYTSDYKEKLRLLGFPHDPTESKLIQSTPVASGSIVSGTVYIIKFGNLIYNGIPYVANDIFTGGAPTTFTGTGTVYLNSQARAYRDTDPYPAGADMIRQIELEILTKELGIEMKEIVDTRNDSRDDTTKSQG